jgi:23S rRNA (guanosine2251-2'-O)-methyltransferase
MVIIGFHAIEAALESGHSVKNIYCLNKDSARAASLRELAQERHAPWKDFNPKDKARFEAEFRRVGGMLNDLESSQGIFAEIGEIKSISHLELLRAAKKREDYPVILYLDEVTDPQNLGSMLRSGAFFGISGIVLTEIRSSPLTPAAIKISSGGFIHVPTARVPNLARALEEAKEEGFWIVGLSEHATERFETARLDAPIGLVIGNEENGMRQLTAKTCDYTLSLPNHGPLLSLNAATAAAVALTLVREKQNQVSGTGGESEE